MSIQQVLILLTRQEIVRPAAATMGNFYPCLSRAKVDSQNISQSLVVHKLAETNIHPAQFLAVHL